MSELSLPTPFSFYAHCLVENWVGYWDLYYFQSIADAQAFASHYPDARITETTPRFIWRVSVPCINLATP